MSLSGALGAAEFSLSTKGNDFYDLSNVDGYNVGMKIEPYNFEMAAGGPATLGMLRPLCGISHENGVERFLTPQEECHEISRAVQQFHHLQL